MARSLWVVILSALTITGAGVQTLLIPAIEFDLIVATVVAIATVAATIVSVDVVIAVVSITSPVIAVPFLITSPVTLVVVASITTGLFPASFPFPLFILAIAIVVPVITLIIAIIVALVAILGLSGAANGGYSQNKCERQKSPANPFSIIFHIRSCLLLPKGRMATAVPPWLYRGIV